MILQVCGLGSETATREELVEGTEARTHRTDVAGHWA